MSPIPSTSSAPIPTALLIEPENGVPASVTPRCSGYGTLLGEHPVGADHRRHVARLDRDLEVVEVEPARAARTSSSAASTSASAWSCCASSWRCFGQRAGVRADPHRDPRRLRGARRPRATLSGPPMLPGLIRTAATPRLDRLQREARVEVDVGDHRQRREPHDPRQRLGVLESSARRRGRSRSRRRRARRSAPSSPRRRASSSASSTARRRARRRRSARPRPRSAARWPSGFEFSGRVHEYGVRLAARRHGACRRPRSPR